MLAVERSEVWTRIGRNGWRAGPVADQGWVRDALTLPLFVLPLAEIPRFRALDILDGRVGKQELQGRYVLVGVTAEGLAQRFTASLFPFPESQQGRQLSEAYEACLAAECISESWISRVCSN